MALVVKGCSLASEINYDPPDINLENDGARFILLDIHGQSEEIHTQELQTNTSPDIGEFTVIMARQEPQQAREVLPIMGKKYSAEILVATSEPRSAQELSDELNIPIATCYRRLEELVEQGLLEQYGTQVGDDNRKIKIYKRTVDDITVDFSGSMSITTQEKSAIRKIDKIWQKLRTTLSN